MMRTLNQSMDGAKFLYLHLQLCKIESDQLVLSLLVWTVWQWHHSHDGSPSYSSSPTCGLPDTLHFSKSTSHPRMTSWRSLAPPGGKGQQDGNRGKIAAAGIMLYIYIYINMSSRHAWRKHDWRTIREDHWGVMSFRRPTTKPSRAFFLSFPERRGNRWTWLTCGLNEYVLNICMQRNLHSWPVCCALWRTLSIHMMYIFATCFWKKHVTIHSTSLELSMTFNRRLLWSFVLHILGLHLVLLIWKIFKNEKHIGIAQVSQI